MHDTLVAIAKSWGLFYMIGISIAVLVWVYLPANRRPFDDAARSIIEAEDRPAEPARSAEATDDPDRETR